MEEGSLRRKFPHLSRQYIGVQNVMDILTELKFLTQSVKVTRANVKVLEYPCIILWEQRRFAVLAGLQGGNYIIYDPRRGPMALSEDQFLTAFGGVAITCSLAGTFRGEAEAPRLELMTVLRQVQGLGASFRYLVIVCVVIFGLTLAVPYYSMWVMDDALAKRDLGLLDIVFIAGLFVMTVKAITELIRDRILQYLGNSFVMQFSRNLVQHLVKLPMTYFETRSAGDILKRIDAIEDVKTIIAERFMISLFDFIILLASAALLFVYSPKLTFVIMASALLSCAYRIAFFPAFKRHRTEVFNLQGDEQSNLLETIRGMQSIKLFSIEQSRLNRWSDINDRKLGSHVAAQKQTTRWKVFDETISAVQGVVLIWLGAKYVLEGSITIGILMSCIDYKGRFNQKLMSILYAAVDFKIMGVHLSRLADITSHEVEEDRDAQDNIRLSGALEIRNLDFRHEPRDPLLFNNLNLQLDIGDSIAIIGPSGCGKSTLLKVMLGLFEVSSGDVLADGFNIRKIQNSYRKSVATVMQDDCILSGSIMDNITFFDKNPDLNAMKRSAEFACIHDDILKMNMGYQTLVSDYSNTISGGQKQRILIARAIYRRPKIIFMDEATSALDIDNERRVNEGMKMLGITRVIVAHRPATILSADKIYRLEGGKLVERDRYELGFSA